MSKVKLIIIIYLMGFFAFIFYREYSQPMIPLELHSEFSQDKIDKGMVKYTLTRDGKVLEDKQPYINGEVYIKEPKSYDTEYEITVIYEDKEAFTDEFSKHHVKDGKIKIHFPPILDLDYLDIYLKAKELNMDIQLSPNTSWETYKEIIEEESNNLDKWTEDEGYIENDEYDNSNETLVGDDDGWQELNIEGFINEYIDGENSEAIINEIQNTTINNGSKKVSELISDKILEYVGEN